MCTVLWKEEKTYTSIFIQMTFTVYSVKSYDLIKVKWHIPPCGPSEYKIPVGHWPISEQLTKMTTQNAMWSACLSEQWIWAERCGYSLYHAHLSTCVEKEMVHATTPAHFPTLLLPHSRELLNHEPHTKHHNCLQGYWYLEGCWGQPGAMGNMSIGERTLNLKSPVQKP